MAGGKNCAMHNVYEVGGVLFVIFGGGRTHKLNCDTLWGDQFDYDIWLNMEGDKTV